MIHLKPIRVNSSYFPDDYDEDKLYQDYEDHDGYQRCYILTSKLPEFFVDLVASWPEKMSTIAQRYFMWTHRSDVIVDKSVSVSIANDQFEFKYKVRFDAEGTNDELRETAENEIIDWISSFTNERMKCKVAEYLGQSFCEVANAVAEQKASPSAFDDFVGIVASCLDVSGQTLMSDVIDSCRRSEHVNMWSDYRIKDAETGIYIQIYLEQTYKASDM